MTVLPQWWRSNFLAWEKAVAAIGTLLFVYLVLCQGGNKYVDVILARDHTFIYGTLASISGSLLGFVMTTTSIVLMASTSPKLKVVRQSPHYPMLWNVFRSATVTLAVALVCSLTALTAGRIDSVRYMALFSVVMVMLLASLRVARVIWILKHVVIIVTTQNPNQTGQQGEHP